MHSLGEVYQAEGKYVQAEALYAKSLEGRRRVIGEEHPDTLRTLVDLGHVRVRQQKYAEATTTLREALNGYVRVRPEDWERYHSQSLLGVSLLGQKRYAEA